MGRRHLLPGHALDYPNSCRSVQSFDRPHRHQRVTRQSAPASRRRHWCPAPWRQGGSHKEERCPHLPQWRRAPMRSEEHTSELQSLMRISYAVFCLKKKKQKKKTAVYQPTYIPVINTHLYINKHTNISNDENT